MEVVGDPREYTKYLDKSFRKTKKADYLYELCALNADTGCGDFNLPCVLVKRKLCR